MKDELILENLSRDAKVDLYEDILRSGISLRLQVTGRSMSPFLVGGEFLTIKKVPCSSLKIGDLIFFKIPDGSPLLHRIVKKQSKNNMYIFQTKGDALLGIDVPVCESDVLGKVCRIEKIVSDDKKEHIDMESRFRKSINYLLATISLARSKTYNAAQRCRLYPSFRCIIKKVLT